MKPAAPGQAGPGSAARKEAEVRRRRCRVNDGCQIPGCDQTQLPAGVFRRCHVCRTHARAPVVHLGGNAPPTRFCQLCHTFHTLERFEGLQRSCKEKLMRHNNRRRLAQGKLPHQPKVEEEAPEPTRNQVGHAPKSVSADSSEARASDPPPLAPLQAMLGELAAVHQAETSSLQEVPAPNLQETAVRMHAFDAELDDLFSASDAFRDVMLLLEETPAGLSWTARPGSVDIRAFARFTGEAGLRLRTATGLASVAERLMRLGGPMWKGRFTLQVGSLVATSPGGGGQLSVRHEQNVPRVSYDSPPVARDVDGCVSLRVEGTGPGFTVQCDCAGEPIRLESVHAYQADPKGRPQDFTVRVALPSGIGMAHGGTATVTFQVTAAGGAIVSEPLTVIVTDSEQLVHEVASADAANAAAHLHDMGVALSFQPLQIGYTEQSAGWCSLRALHYALVMRWPTAVRAMLACPAVMLAEPAAVSRLLATAVSVNDPDVLAAWLDAGREHGVPVGHPCQRLLREGLTPLHLAAVHSSWEVLLNLMAREDPSVLGAWESLTDDKGRAPVQYMLAAQKDLEQDSRAPIKLAAPPSPSAGRRHLYTDCQQEVDAKPAATLIPADMDTKYFILWDVIYSIAYRARNRDMLLGHSSQSLRLNFILFILAQSCMLVKLKVGWSKSEKHKFTANVCTIVHHLCLLGRAASIMLMDSPPVVCDVGPIFTVVFPLVTLILTLRTLCWTVCMQNMHMAGVAALSVPACMLALGEHCKFLTLPRIATNCVVGVAPILYQRYLRYARTSALAKKLQ
mmetsp:Transcript_10986/g.38122  ORF Transcript_10986/g.38122 Transcript_10986/m.38122 type:complete len:794 (-) Transcript_10986:35-2416(-)